MTKERRKELLAILITVDGKGKAAKEDALEELLETQYAQGYLDGQENMMGME